MFHAFVDVCRLFSKLIFSKNYFRNTISVSNDLDPDQGQYSVCPDVGQNCSRRLLVDDKKNDHHLCEKLIEIRWTI